MTDIDDVNNLVQFIQVIDLRRNIDFLNTLLQKYGVRFTYTDDSILTVDMYDNNKLELPSMIINDAINIIMNNVQTAQAIESYIHCAVNTQSSYNRMIALMGKSTTSQYPLQIINNGILERLDSPVIVKEYLDRILNLTLTQIGFTDINLPIAAVCPIKIINDGLASILAMVIDTQMKTELIVLYLYVVDYVQASYENAL